MLCPNCAADNIPGVDICEECGTDLAGLDLPEARSGFRGKLLNARVGDLPTMPAVIVSPDETVRDAIERMREAQAGCVLVQEDGELVGLFNERHVLTRVLRKDLDATTTPISRVMSPKPLKLSPEDPPAFAIHCMVAYGFRHLPLVSGREVLGYVSVRTILAFLHKDVIARAAVAS
ncbi:MAG: CBS domain-containing protein [bacterium]|nr:CBS domain-containing protein [bacterium]